MEANSPSIHSEKNCGGRAGEVKSRLQDYWTRFGTLCDCAIIRSTPSGATRIGSEGKNQSLLTSAATFFNQVLRPAGCESRGVFVTCLPVSVSITGAGAFGAMRDGPGRMAEARGEEEEEKGRSNDVKTTFKPRSNSSSSLDGLRRNGGGGVQRRARSTGRVGQHARAGSATGRAILRTCSQLRSSTLTRQCRQPKWR